MKRYKCHKIVEATKVVAIEELPYDEVELMGEDRMTYVLPISRFGWKSGKMVMPNPFGYMVRYEDGYLSWSPSKAFEDGYTLIEERVA